jgi:phosphonate transport system permease protein
MARLQQSNPGVATPKKPLADFMNQHFHHLLFKKVEVTDEKGQVIATIEKPRNLGWLLAILIAVVFGLCFIVIKLRPIKWDQLGVLLSQLFVPSKWSLKTSDGWWNYLWTKACPGIWTTIEMVYIATFVGVLISIPVYILAARNIDRSRIIRWIVKFFLNVVRTIPTYVLAIIATIFFGYNETAGVFIRTFPEILFCMILVQVTGVGPVTGVVVLSFQSVGMIGKMYSDDLDSMNTSFLESLDASGATTLSKIRVGVFPQVFSNFISTVLYRFDLNLRNAAILGIVGAGDMGRLILSYSSDQNWPQLGALLWGLLVMVLIVDAISTAIRKKLV